MGEIPTDADIIGEALTRPAVFAGIFDRHYDSIQSYLARRLPHDLAEEVSAETFLAAFEQRDDYDPAYPSARPWLFGIATNLLSRHRREERRRMVAYERALPAPPEDGTDDIAARADAAMQRRLLAGALADLQPGDRDALLLQALAGLTYPEIALALEVPVGTVKSRLHRTREQLARVLAPEGVKANG